jgi:diadenylate cyclase
MQLVQLILDQVRLNTVVDIVITALLIYGLFSLIRGTRAVSLVIGVTVMLLVYAGARFFDLRLLRQVLETGALVGVFALVVVFQPELRRALDRLGRVGSFAWLLSGSDERVVGHVAAEVAHACGLLAAERTGALIVIERETALGEIAETGVMLHADLTADLLRTIFMPRSPLHDGAVIIRGDQVVAAGAVLPLAETTILPAERFGTRHRAAVGIAEQTDAVVVVVSEETGQTSLVERARIVRNLNPVQLERALIVLLDTSGGRRSMLGRMPSGSLRPSSARISRLRRAGQAEPITMRTAPGGTVAAPTGTAPAAPAEGTEPAEPTPATGSRR